MAIHIYLLFCFISSYQMNEHNKVGVYVAADHLSPENYYFETEILDLGQIGAIGKSFRRIYLSYQFHG